MNIVKQTPKDAFWIDEASNSIPYKRTTPAERKREAVTYSLAKQAYKISQQLADFKALVRNECDDLISQVLNDKERQNRKGNITLYNFRGDIKVEVNVQDNIQFDDLLIEKAKQKLFDYIGEGIAEKTGMKDLVLSAFQSSKGKLDAKKIHHLKKQLLRIDDERCKDAARLIDESTRRPDSKTYYRVWTKDENGAWQNIDLNFSSI